MKEHLWTQCLISVFYILRSTLCFVAMTSMARNDGGNQSTLLDSLKQEDQERGEQSA